MPLLLPDTFRHTRLTSRPTRCPIPVTGHDIPEVNTTDIKDAESYFVLLADTIEAKRSHKKVVLGTYYKNLYPGYTVIDPEANDYDIVLDIGGGKTTTVHVRSAFDKHSLLKAGTNLGNRVSVMKAQNMISSVRVGDFGSMHAIGYRESDVGTEYKGTDECRNETLEFAEEMGAFLLEKLPHTRQSIAAAEMEKMGESGEKCESFNTRNPNNFVGNTVNISIDLGNSGHFDCFDDSLCASLWVSRNGKFVKNWYFVLPHASINGSKGVIICLSHGVVVAWDGDALKHLSAIPDVEEGDNVYGVFVGSTSSPKVK